MKFVFVVGGVLSGLGKGVTASSIGLLLKSHGIRVTAMKCDMYLNIDAGTMNPLEHGEVFVTHDGLETDQDLGHYERFLDINLTRDNYMTNGQIYKFVLAKERALDYGGACVQPYHHLPPEIIKRWRKAGKASNAQVAIIELGGTVGEYEGLLFFESIRRLKLKTPKDVVLVYVGYLPAPGSIGELKSKPIQQSVSILNSLGLQPDIIVGRAEKPIDNIRKEKIALASGLSSEDIVSNPDMDSVYNIPLYLQSQGVAKKILRKLRLKGKKTNHFARWKKMVAQSDKATGNINITIGIIGKYQNTGDYLLEDAYVCVVEAIRHASTKLGLKTKIEWIDSSTLEKLSENKLNKRLSSLNAILVPQGWGTRGCEGKIRTAKYARENKVPYLGLCYGMQMATIEFARNVCSLANAHSEEINPKTKHPVIHIMPKQKDYLANKQYGGTIRLGAWPCSIKKGTLLAKAYDKWGGGLSEAWYKPNPSTTNKAKGIKGKLVFERHRHRYELNNKYKSRLEMKGFIVSGTSPDKKLVEAIELPNHPFFLATQYHPEYLSRPLSPHPIFLSFIESIHLNDNSR